jgi:probable F420-dependent oxidoreductase
LRAIEAMGISTVVMADHWTDGYDTEPMVALAMAAATTSTLRVQTGVLGNDYRHPVLTHRMAATLQLLSGGRLVLGLGAGWLTTDYETAGIPLDPPAVRVDRLEEAVGVIKGLFRPEPLTHTGTHYRISGLDGLPKVVPPRFFIGGGRPRVLRLAGREADVVGINAGLREGALGAHAIADFGAERVAEKIAWVAEGAAAAGRSLDDIDLELNHWLVRVTPTVVEAGAFLDRMAARFGIESETLDESPAVLVGTVERLAAKLRADRDRFGINVVQLDAGFHPQRLDDLSPLVEQLAGT